MDKLSLGCFPTPLHELSRLSNHLGGPKIFIKRDDLTGLALGGNKTRKLEFLLADALEQGCDTVITAGAVQSNHCRQTAAAAGMLGLECHLVLGGEAPDTNKGNLLLNHLLDSKIHWAGENRKGEDIPEIKSQLTAQGQKPYIVPYGGSNEIGALGFVEATRELVEQCADANHSFSHLVFASSSGGTHAGLALGKKLYKQDYTVLGINIEKVADGSPPLESHFCNLTSEAAKQLSSNIEFSAKDINLNSGYVGDGYAVIGDLEREAILLTAKTEGILLDPVYTGRAMGGLIALIRQGYFNKTDSVLFWHTGGAPAVFAYGDEILNTG